MNRRTFLLAALFVAVPAIAEARTRRFRFRIKTKSGGLIGTTEEGSDIDDAKQKVRKRYPDCEFLSSEEIG